MGQENNNVGRPLKFKNNKVLQDNINSYFESCFELQWKDRDYRDEEGNRIKEDGVYKKEPYQEKVMIKVPTISGLAVYLNTSRKVLMDYENEMNKSKLKKEFSYTIKKAKQFIESIVEEGMLNGTFNSTGSIFNLKNNFNRIDKQELDNKISGSFSLVDLHKNAKK